MTSNPPPNRPGGADSTSLTTAQPAGFSAINPPEAEQRATYKSWKKKFRKMKHRFDQKMRESDQLFHEEIKAKETMRRLQQSNDRLLDMMLDLNESVNIPPTHRYDLGAPDAPDIDQVPDLESDEPGYSPPDSVTSVPKFRQLLRIPHTDIDQLKPDDLPEDLLPAKPIAYLGPSQEQEYLDTLDKSLGLTPAAPRSSSQTNGTTANGGRSGSEPPEPAPNPAVQNPVSVYNWLRKHQPQVFLQDHEMSSDKATKTGDKRGAGKRASIAAAKATPEFVDDESYIFGYDQPATSSGGGRRKKEEDPGYRPKGGGGGGGGSGGSGRSLKRKREGGADEGPGSSSKAARKRSTGANVKGH